jgi:uncharacterized membrane protein YczE
MKLGNWVVMLLTMMIVLEFLGIPTGLSSTLSYFGVNINPVTSQLVSADIGNSSFWSYIFGEGLGILLILLGGGAIIVGLFAKSYDTSLVILPLITTIAGLFIGTFWSIIKYTQMLGQDWMTALIATIFIALGAGFIFSCVDYFAGR